MTGVCHGSSKYFPVFLESISSLLIFTFYSALYFLFLFFASFHSEPSSFHQYLYLKLNQLDKYFWHVINYFVFSSAVSWSFIFVVLLTCLGYSEFSFMFFSTSSRLIGFCGCLFSSARPLVSTNHLPSLGSCAGAPACRVSSLPSMCLFLLTSFTFPRVMSYLLLWWH